MHELFVLLECFKHLIANSQHVENSKWKAGVLIV